MTGYRCKDCGHVAPSLPKAHKHAKEAGPVWSSERQTFVSHRLDSITEEQS